jgi:hypothetical protein
MRALLLTLLVACTPTVVPGSYLCGPERLCPEGQACNGPDNVCVSQGTEQPFACDPEGIDPVGDDTPATGAMVNDLLCVSTVNVVTGCMRATDTADYVQFDVPTGCTAVGVTAKVTFPIAFQPLALTIAKGTEPPQQMETECPSSAQLVEGEDERCLEMTLEPGAHYALGVVHDETVTADCDGACRDNRYQLRLETP